MMLRQNGDYGHIGDLMLDLLEDCRHFDDMIRSDYEDDGT
jgi:hypothetical protein